jgi:hypothetical protein
VTVSQYTMYGISKGFTISWFTVSNHLGKMSASRPPLWSSGQSSWLQIQRSRFDSRRYLIFWEVVGLERGPFSLVSTSEELLERKSSCSGPENLEYGRGDPLRWLRDNLYPQKLVLTSPKAAVAQSVYFARGIRTRNFFVRIWGYTLLNGILNWKKYRRK